jgi:hypothetical protein
VAQAVEEVQSPEFKTQYCQNKKKKRAAGNLCVVFIYWPAKVCRRGPEAGIHLQLCVGKTRNNGQHYPGSEKGKYLTAGSFLSGELDPRY